MLIERKYILATILTLIWINLWNCLALFPWKCPYLSSGAVPLFRLALIANLSARRPEVTLWCHLLALPPDRNRLSRLWIPLFELVSPLTYVFCHRTFLLLFIGSWRLYSLNEPELGAPLNSYLEWALKFNICIDKRKKDDRPSLHGSIWGPLLRTFIKSFQLLWRRATIREFLLSQSVSLEDYTPCLNKNYMT